ncbi:MAG: hypothetical protein U0401_14550 [Anaerolineae bacterium]
MAKLSNQIEVYLEVGQKRTFAGALEWPGWCRAGRDEVAALQALVEMGPPYARILHPAGIEFQPPAAVSDFVVVERLEGNATTDFGAPNVAPRADTRPIDEAELQCLQALLQAYWQAFAETVQAADGKDLRLGPRGGGRDLAGIVQHVVGAQGGYLSRLAWKFKPDETENPIEAVPPTRQAVLEALAAAVHDGLPAHGPRGGAIWLPRYFVRRSAWHILDHLWEIEDRLLA